MPIKSDGNRLTLSSMFGVSEGRRARRRRNRGERISSHENRRAIPLAEILESRTLLTVALFPDPINVGKSIVRFEELGGGNQRLDLSLSGGLLSYRLNGGAASTDLDTTAAGVQSRSISNLSKIDVSLDGGSDTLAIDHSGGLVKPSPSGIGFDGGAGSDALSVVGADTNYNLTDTQLTSPLAGTVALIGVEAGYLTGGNSDNTFDARGFTGSTILSGQGGSDVFYGGSGPDLIISDSGSDFADGGPGNDTIYSGNSGGTIYGGEGDDTLIGNNGKDIFYGGPGNDSLSGNNGVDSLYGEAGDDTFLGGNGNDALDGGDGLDRVLSTSGGAVFLSNSSIIDEGTDSLLNIESATLTGTSGTDTLDALAFTGELIIDGAGGGGDLLIGGQGKNIFRRVKGQTGNVRMRGGPSNDLYELWLNDEVIIEESGGRDTIDLTSSDAGVTLSLAIQDGSMQSVDSKGSKLAITGQVEELYATAFDDSITGNDADNMLYGGSLSGGGGGTSSLFDGNDILDGGAGNDYLDGGSGNDVLYGASRPGTGGGTTSLFDNDILVGGDGEDLLIGGPGDDQLYGASRPGAGGGTTSLFDGSDILEGGDGNDYLSGGDGDDQLYGASRPGAGGGTTSLFDGADLIEGGDGNDYISGGAGDDQLYGASRPGAGGGTTSLFDGADLIEGGDGNDYISGGDGDDQLYGASRPGAGGGTTSLFDGADLIEGGDGNDYINGGAGDDVLYGASRPGAGGGTTSLFDGADLIEGGDGNDYINGGAGNDELYGASRPGTGGGTTSLFDGDDTIEGGEGNDSISGGPGDDSLYGASRPGTGGGTTSLFDDDVIEGNDGNDYINGGDGNDQLYGASRPGAGGGTTSLFDGADVIEGGNGADIIDGGPGDDQLYGASRPGSGGTSTTLFDAGDLIEGGDGNDFLDGGPGDDFLYGASRPGSGGGTTSLFDDDVLVGGDGNDYLSGGDGNDSLYGASRPGGGGGTTSLFDDDTLEGGDGSDLLSGDGGNDVLRGNGGNDRYLFIGSAGGSVTIDEVANLDVDSLDFAAWWSAVAVDLSLTTAQVVGGGLALTLTSGTGIENVVGSAFADQILGNARDNNLTGAAPFDDRAANPAPSYAPVQVVYVDFETGTDPLVDHVYTSVERDAILARMEEIYGPFQVDFTQVMPTTGAETFATLFINEKAIINGVPRSGGAASEVDPRNVNPGGSAVIDVNEFLGGPDQPVATSANFVSVTATIAAHEMGHLLGLRHADSFGPIGYGINSPPGTGDDQPGGPGYFPAYPGLVQAFETTSHLMATPASVGSSLFDAAQGPFLGERESTKLAFNQAGQVVAERASPHRTRAQAQPIALAALEVPNLLRSGLNFGRDFAVNAVTITASIAIDASTGRSESDFYSFFARAGDLINIETFSKILDAARVADPIDSILKVYDALGNLLSFGSGQALNDDEFETADSAIVDLKIPAEGTYTIEVDTYSSDDPAINVEDTDIGDYELFVYRFSTGNKMDGDDVLDGRTGSDTLAGGLGNDQYLGVFAAGSTTRLFDDSGIDKLNFANATAGITANLSLSTGQTQALGTGNGTLAVSGTIETILGTAFSDTLTGNSAANTIRGFGGADTLAGLAGDDVLDGGTGNDVIRGGDGNDIGMGGDGDDSLQGENGRDLLIGGAGVDTINGGNDENILIGSATLFDAQDAALTAIVAEWSSSRTVAQRLANLRGVGTGPRLNGSFFLVVPGNNYGQPATVLDDRVADTLSAGAAADWFLTFAKDKSPKRKEDFEN